MVTFAVHDLLIDPPFTHIDLLTCRNLLIYLDTNAQYHLLTLFHYALRSGGLLFLGASETIGNLGSLFTTLDGHWKIFAQQDETPVPYPLPEHGGPFSAASRPSYSHGEPARLGVLNSQAAAYLAHRFAPPSVLITAHGDNAINALVPGRPGELRITAAAGPETTAFHIQDNGRSIAADDISKVFEVFRGLYPQEAAGAGMGLAYVRTLVRRHSGDVRCQSTPAVGTTFTFIMAKHLDDSPPPHAAGTALP
jgi:two-component system, chemotaxis family, CheB/CheR fusion protein